MSHLAAKRWGILFVAFCISFGEMGEKPGILRRLLLDFTTKSCYDRTDKVRKIAGRVPKKGNRGTVRSAV